MDILRAIAFFVKWYLERAGDLAEYIAGKVQRRFADQPQSIRDEGYRLGKQLHATTAEYLALSSDNPLSLIPAPQLGTGSNLQTRVTIGIEFEGEEPEFRMLDADVLPGETREEYEARIRRMAEDRFGGKYISGRLQPPSGYNIQEVIFWVQ